MLLACGGAKIDNDDAEDDEDAEDDDDAKTMMTRIWAVAAASGNSHRAGPTELAVAATRGNSHRAWSAECRWQQRVPKSKGFAPLMSAQREAGNDIPKSKWLRLLG